MDPESGPAGGLNSIPAGFLVFIPLWPYGPQEWRTKIFNRFTLKDEVTAVVTRDVTASGLAEDLLTGTPEAARALPSGARPHVLHLTLHEAVWNRNYTTYGLSLGGAFLWLFSAPLSFGSGILDFTAEVSGPDGETLGGQRFSAERSVTEWPYSRGNLSGPFSDAYTEISPKLRELMRSAFACGPTP